MNKLFVSMGLAAVSAASVQLAQADGTDGKVWNASLSLRGFYDDNYTTASSGSKGSYGLEVSPTVSASVPLRQTDIGLRYTYGLYYYEERDHLGQNAIDQSHQVDLWVDHAFSETQHGKVEDTFAVGQEPQLLGGSGLVTRVNGNNFANTGTLDWQADWSRDFGTDVQYQNSYYNFDNTGYESAGNVASLDGLLGRDENNVSIKPQWILSPHTTLFVGYTLGFVNYLADEQIDVYNNKPIMSDSRNSISHEVYVGANVDLLANLRFEGSVGLEYADYYNQIGGGDSSTSPYADISLTYTYLPGDYVQVGFTSKQTAVDAISHAAVDGKVTTDQQAYTAFGSINHHLTQKLVGSVIGQWSYFTFDQGAYNNDVEKLYSVGVNLTYNITEHFSADAGYNYDDLQSDIGRGYNRNRVYVGVTASY